MSEMKYLDFDVAIEPTPDGFATRVFNSPAGQAAGTFSAPFSDLEIENFLLRVGRSRHAVRRIESPEMASAKAFGGRLFDQVFTGDVRGCLRSSIDEASRQGAGLRVRLHLTKAPALADLPWEFLYNASMNRFLSLSVETPLVRYLELPERIRPVTVQPPLHVLMMISSPSDYPQLDVKRETSKIEEALSELEQRGLVTVERLEDATLSELQRRLRSGEYHIFHFVGHGGFDPQADDGLLIMEDQENRGRRVSAQFLGTLLHDHRPLRLAVLNACEGARSSRGDPFAGTAQSLVQQGIPAVIAMQFEVTDEAAICFTREFYSAIAVGYPVDAALAEARKAIFAEVSEIEWGTPVLYMRSPDGRVFEIEQVSEAARKQLQVSSLMSAARTAARSNDSATAIDKLNQLLALDAAHVEASALLREITEEQERELAKASAEERHERTSADQVVRTEIEQSAEVETRTAPPRRRPLGWFFVGGALGAFAVVAMLIVGGIAMAIFLGSQQEKGSAANSSNDPAASSPILPVASASNGPVDVKVPPLQPIDTKPAQTVPADPPMRETRASLTSPAAAQTRENRPRKGQAAIDPKASQSRQPLPAPVREVPVQQFEAPPAVEQRPAPPTAVYEPPIVTPLLRATLEAVIRRASEAEIQAFRTLNPAVLTGSYTGKILDKQVEGLRTYASNQIAMVNRLHDQRFESFTLSPDGRRAEVRLTEVWSTDFHSTITRQCLSHFHEHPVPQTISLQLTNQGWMIYDVEHHAPAPQMAACH